MSAEEEIKQSINTIRDEVVSTLMGQIREGRALADVVDELALVTSLAADSTGLSIREAVVPVIEMAFALGRTAEREGVVLP